MESLITKIPQSFVLRRLHLANQELQKAKELLSNLEEEVMYWKGLVDESEDPASDVKLSELINMDRNE